MRSPLPALCLPTLLLAVSGCQSASVVPVVLECPPEQAPPAWMMEPSAPTYTQRLLQALSQ